METKGVTAMTTQPWRGDAWQEIYLDAMRYNIEQTIAHAPGVNIAAVVKADAYGHGIARTAKLFHESGAALIATASIREALYLRARFPDMPLWSMGAASNDLIGDAIECGIALTVCSLDEARSAAKSATLSRRVAHVHVKVDTGFHRLGVGCEEAPGIIAEMATIPGILIDGVFTHLALLDEAHDMAQVERFEKISKELCSNNITVPRHICDSIALFRYPQWRWDMARVGALLYGNKSREAPFTPRRAMRLCARIVSIREIEPGEGVGYDEEYFVSRRTRIATLPIGYADGLPRALRQHGQAALHGKRAPYAGLPCMDQVMLDVTDIPGARIGDTVTLLGGEGADAITLEEFASWLGTNRNEPLCLTGRRVPRVYMDGGNVVGVDDPLER